MYIDQWDQAIKREPKMRTYSLFKSSFHMEKYLSNNNEKQRKAITRFRISAHRLAVALGQHKRPPVPLEQRICPHCPDSTFEDEFHFLMNCTKYKVKRKILFMMMMMISQFNGTSTPKGSYSAKAGVNYPINNCLTVFARSAQISKF